MGEVLIAVDVFVYVHVRAVTVNTFYLAGFDTS